MVSFYSASHIGKVRKENQDAVYVNLLSNGYFLGVVCDGMGGHAGGKVAATETIKLLSLSLNEIKIKNHTIKQKLWDTAKNVNHFIYQMSEANPALNNMGTTLTAFLFKDRGGVLQIGDSRMYHFNNDKLTQITEDQTFVNELVKHGLITKEQAFVHPERNKITAAVGSKQFSAEYTAIDKVEGQYLICSDGFYNEVMDRDIIPVLSSSLSIKEKCNQLMDLALRYQASDNISIVLIEVRHD